MYDPLLLAGAHAATDPMASPECRRHLREAYYASCSSDQAAEEPVTVEAQSKVQVGQLRPAAATPGAITSFAAWWKRHGVLLLIGLVTFSGQLSAQTVSSIEAGDRVRIESEEVSGEFTVPAVQADTLSIPRGAGLVKVRISQLRGLEVLRRRSALQGAGRGFLIGGGIGAAAGAVIGYYTYEECETDVPLGCLLAAESRGEEAMFGAVLLGMLGGLGGLLVGSESPGGRWEEVSLR